MSGRTTKLLPLLILVFVGVVRAEEKLSDIIGVNMVLQQGAKARIGVNAKPGEEVIVTFANKSANAVADAQGRWQAWIGPLKAGGPSELTVNDQTIKNVLVGEVWLCSGQSNMEWPLSNTVGGAETVAQANYP